MTLDEMIAREAIRRTMAAYTTAGDRLREEAFAAVFTVDAVLESQGVGERDLFRHEGRESIRAWIARWRAPAAGKTHGATFVRHHLSTCDIDLTGPNNARARTYWTAWTDIGPDHAGYYLDDFAREDDRWLIRHRRIRLDWQSPDSLFTTAVTNSRHGASAVVGAAVSSPRPAAPAATDGRTIG